MRSVELFAGGGGLALGMAQAGFEHVALVEKDTDSCNTLRLNKAREIEHARDWNILEEDVTEFDYGRLPAVDVIGGGVPCQPFSLGGKHRAHNDKRDMFPAFAHAVAELRPKAFVCENVKGLLRGSFAEYFEYITLRLAHPTVEGNGDWRKHCRQLERIHTSGKKNDLDYNAVFALLNSANFGVPQRRERVFIVGIRSDLGIEFSFPEATHGADALLRDKWVTGDYWERHRIAKKHRPEMNPRLSRRVEMLRSETPRTGELKPWQTVRDALQGLKRLQEGHTDHNDPNHFLNPGARSYKGHTGSPYDEPAKTLKAGDHGVPGGENTLAPRNGEVRYFSVREAARIQTFPDNYWFSGAWTDRMRQVGNAVPVQLARAVAQRVIADLSTG